MSHPFPADRRVERALHTMRGDAARAPDFTAGIMARVEQASPFASPRALRLRRWGRVVSGSAAVGIAMCAGVVAAQWTQIAPALTGRPASLPGPLSSTVAAFQSGSRSIRQVPTRLATLVRDGAPTLDPQGSGTEIEGVALVRAVASDIILPMGAALRVAPPLEPAAAERDLAGRLIAGGQRIVQEAERLASAVRVAGGGAGTPASETYTDRIVRAVGGARPGDSGPR